MNCSFFGGWIKSAAWIYLIIIYFIKVDLFTRWFFNANRKSCICLLIIHCLAINIILTVKILFEQPINTLRSSASLFTRWLLLFYIQLKCMFADLFPIPKIINRWMKLSIVTNTLSKSVNYSECKHLTCSAPISITLL
jgi:hypothetical protein